VAWVGLFLSLSTGTERVAPVERCRSSWPAVLMLCLRLCTGRVQSSRAPGTNACRMDGRVAGHAILLPSTPSPPPCVCICVCLGRQVPDGSIVDSAGYLWNAEFFSGRVVRCAAAHTCMTSIAPSDGGSPQGIYALYCPALTI
jgi:hypothetical protein